MVGQQLLDRSAFLLAPDEAGEVRRQVVGSGLQRSQRREIGWQVGCDDLKDVLGTGNIFELVDTQIAQVDAVRQLVPDQFVGGGREQDLAAVATCQQARGAVEQRADII